MPKKYLRVLLAIAMCMMLPSIVNAHISFSIGIGPGYYPPPPSYYYPPPPPPEYYYPPPVPAYYYPYSQVWIEPYWNHHRYYPGHYQRYCYRNRHH